MARRPSSLRDLLLWLRCHPRVLIHSRFRPAREVGFTGYLDGVLHWSDDSFHAVRCQLEPNADRAETGLTFDATGFEVEKHGSKIRFSYVIQEKPDATKKATKRRQQPRARRRKATDE